MDRRLRSNLACTCLLVLSLVPLVTGSSPAAAESDILPVDVYLCDRIPDYLPSQGSTQPIPDGCVGEDGVKITTWSADGIFLGSCTTGPDGGCGVPSILDAVVVVAEDPATIPDGYEPIRNPDVSWKATEYRASGFVNVALDAATGDSPETNENPATLTINSRFCPPGYAGPDFYTACDPTPPPYQQAFNLHGPSTRAGWVNDDGNITLEDLAPGDYSFVAGIPEATSRVFVYCSLTDDPDVRVPASSHLSPYSPPNDYAIHLTLEPGSDVLCDFYPIPVDKGAPVPARNGEEFPVLVITCDEDPGLLDTPSLVPRGCAPVTGASLIAQRINSTVSGECATADGGWCDLRAFSDEPAVVTLDPSALPPGYLPTHNPFAVNIFRGFAGLTFVALPRPESSGAATLTIRARLCPAGYDGTDRVDNCVQTLPETLFTVIGPETTSDRPTGGDGNIVFDDLSPGDYAVRSGIEGESISHDIECADAHDPSVAVPTDRLNELPDAPLYLTLATGDSIVCDWYSTRV